VVAAPVGAAEHRRPIYDICRSHLTKEHVENVLLLSGIRGAGKSTLLLQLAQDLVASGTDPRSSSTCRSSTRCSDAPSRGHPPHLPEMIHPLERRAVLLLDELHYAKEWDSQVKQLLFDENDYRIIATESVQMIERALITETQLGRWAAVPVPSLSFHEYLKVKRADPGEGATPELIDLFTMREDQLAAVHGALKPLAEHFPHYLTTGGLPGSRRPPTPGAARRCSRRTRPSASCGARSPGTSPRATWRT
jgi:predicted AAA+ superfamily ATPase